MLVSKDINPLLSYYKSVKYYLLLVGIIITYFIVAFLANFRYFPKLKEVEQFLLIFIFLGIGIYLIVANPFLLKKNRSPEEEYLYQLQKLIDTVPFPLTVALVIHKKDQRSFVLQSLAERYKTDVESHGIRKAKRLLWEDIFNSYLHFICYDISDRLNKLLSFFQIRFK